MNDDTATTRRSERFRARVFDSYETMSPADLELIDEVCLTLDFLDTLRQQIADQPLVQTRQGGLRVSPLVVEERLRAQHLAALLRRFPEITEDDLR